MPGELADSALQWRSARIPWSKDIGSDAAWNRRDVGSRGRGGKYRALAFATLLMIYASGRVADNVAFHSAADDRYARLGMFV